MRTHARTSPNSQKDFDKWIHEKKVHVGNKEDSKRKRKTYTHTQTRLSPRLNEIMPRIIQSKGGTQNVNDFFSRLRRTGFFFRLINDMYRNFYFFFFFWWVAPEYRQKQRWTVKPTVPRIHGEKKFPAIKIIRFFHFSSTRSVRSSSSSSSATASIDRDEPASYVPRYHRRRRRWHEIDWVRFQSISC